MKTFGDYIGNAQIKEALNLLPQELETEKIMLIGRISNLERRVMLGTIDSKDENLERNRIVNAAMSLGEEAGLLPKGKT